MIDIFIVGFYLALILLVGIYNKNNASNFSGYNNIGNDLSKNKIILTATIFASAVGGGTTFGITEHAFNKDLSYAYGLLLTIPIDILIAKYLVPKIEKYQGVSSIGEIVLQHYGKYAQIIIGVAATLISIGYLAVQISVSGRIFSFLLGLEYIYAMVISYIIVITYTTIGGFRAVVINNSLQFFAMIIAIPILTIWGIEHAGFKEFFASIPSEKYNLLSSSELAFNTIYAVLSFSVMGFYPSFIQRILIKTNSSSITKAIYYKSAIYALFIICLSINGLLALHLIPSSSTELCLTSLVDLIIPIGLKGLIMIGLIAAVTSTADSDINISAISVVNDVLKPLNIANSQKNLLIAAKIFAVLIGSSTILLVLKFKNIVDLIIFSAGLWAPVALVPLVGILLNKIISKKGFYACALTGSSCFIILENTESHMAVSSIFFSTLASLLCFILFLNFDTNKNEI